MTESVNSARPLALSPSAIQALQSIASAATTGVTVICGFPAAGKTTATRILSTTLNPVVLDKDTFAPQLEESVMSELTGNPHDRDSDIYRSVVSPHLYAALVRQAVNIAQRCPVVVDAPFLGYIQIATDRGLSLAEQIRSVTATPDALIRTVWVSADAEQIRDRMVQRGADRDRPKLSNWHGYRTAVLNSALAQAGPLVVDHVVPN